tara:strand:- start:218 stop:418 length:201 start_codon:yes stop_codon:yes gene_type:complete
MRESYIGLTVDRIDSRKWVVYAVAPHASRNHSLALYEGKKWVLLSVRLSGEIFEQFENQKGFPKSA